MLRNKTDIIDPILLAKKHIGQPVSQYSRDFIHQNLGAKICKNQKCHDKLDEQIAKIESYHSINDAMHNSSKYLETIQYVEQLVFEFKLKINIYYLMKQTYVTFQNTLCLVMY